VRPPGKMSATSLELSMGVVSRIQFSDLHRKARV
jgi:hypothetical protein